MFVLKKDRQGKLSPRAVKCIWNGAHMDQAHSISAIPIQEQPDGTWELLKPIHSTKVTVVRGWFPLRMAANTKLPVPPEITLEAADEVNSVPDEESPSQEYEVSRRVAFHALWNPIKD